MLEEAIKGKVGWQVPGLGGRELLLEEAAVLVGLSLAACLRLPVDLLRAARRHGHRASAQRRLSWQLSVCEWLLMSALVELAVQGQAAGFSLAQAWFLLLGSWLGVALWNGSLQREGAGHGWKQLDAMAGHRFRMGHRRHRRPSSVPCSNCVYDRVARRV